VDIESFYVGAGSAGAGLRLAEMPSDHSVEAERLPYRMDGTSVRNWKWNFNAAVLELLTSGKLAPRPTFHFTVALLPLPALFIAVALATGEAHARFSPRATIAMYREFRKLTEPGSTSGPEITGAAHGTEPLDG
jgi:hypothetical protein